MLIYRYQVTYEYVLSPTAYNQFCLAASLYFSVCAPKIVSRRLFTFFSQATDSVEKAVVRCILYTLFDKHVQDNWREDN